MRTTLATLALTAALALPGAGSAAPLDLSDMSEADRAAFGEQVRAYLLENPEVLMEALQVFDQRRSAAAQDADRQLVAENAERLFDDGFSWVGGNPDGDVTLVEFLDYRCGYCKKAQPEVEALLERDPNLRLVVKEFPILGPESVTAGKMALAALELDRAKFGPLHHALMDYRGNLTEEAAYELAGEAGYDLDKLRELAGSTEIADRLQKNYQLAQALGLQGTPAFVVGDQIIRGYLPADELAAAVEEARAAQN
ncbi:MAG TPA: DsbA family protein [Paracoccaceae bacterium]|nr:DsbA family protein [Paracoccaceae bacterium]